MSIVDQISHLEALVALDARIRELSEQLEKEQSSVAGVRTELSETEAQLEHDRESVSEMEKTRQELHQELRQYDKQLERSRDRLGRARTERESQAAEREVEELRKLQRERDEEVRRVGSLIEQARASIDEDEARVEALRADLAGTTEGAVAAAADVTTQLEQRKKERTDLVKKLPQRVVRRYETLLPRRPVPVAKTHDGTCLGCHIGLPPALFHEMLSRVRFEECPHCHRIIYYEPPSPPADEAGAS